MRWWKSAFKGNQNALWEEGTLAVHGSLMLWVQLKNLESWHSHGCFDTYYLPEHCYRPNIPLNAPCHTAQEQFEEVVQGVDLTSKYPRDHSSIDGMCWTKESDQWFPSLPYHNTPVDLWRQRLNVSNCFGSTRGTKTILHYTTTLQLGRPWLEKV